MESWNCIRAERFAEGEFELAADRYAGAIAAFGAKPGAGAQRDEKVKIFSNRAECLLKLKRWAQAASDASAALELDERHEKSLLRRAKAQRAARR